MARHTSWGESSPERMVWTLSTSFGMLNIKTPSPWIQWTSSVPVVPNVDELQSCTWSSRMGCNCLKHWWTDSPMQSTHTTRARKGTIKDLNGERTCRNITLLLSQTLLQVTLHNPDRRRSQCRNRAQNHQVSPKVQHHHRDPASLRQHQNRFLSRLLPTREGKGKGKMKEHPILGENMKTVERAMVLYLIVAVTGTIIGRTATTEDGEDNTLDLCIGPAGWWNAQSLLKIYLSDIDDIYWERLLSRLINPNSRRFHFYFFYLCNRHDDVWRFTFVRWADFKTRSKLRWLLVMSGRVISSHRQFSV